MVRVEVQVSHLAIDLKKKERMFRKGDTFVCSAERAKSLGNSVTIIPDDVIDDVADSTETSYSVDAPGDKETAE